MSTHTHTPKAETIATNKSKCTNFRFDIRIQTNCLRQIFYFTEENKKIEQKRPIERKEMVQKLVERARIERVCNVYVVRSMHF